LLGPLGSDQYRDSIVALAFATTSYFLLNTVLVSAAVCLASHQPWFATWRRGYMWTAPSFYAGSICSLAASFVAQRFELHTFLITLLPLLLVYYSYRHFVSRMVTEEARTR
ncbi:MAG: hypothetical protein HY652_15830, partial [Acidobacteria bacterium]|nr:hypothetical protein [Acidobacteriota bacterium]